MEKRSLTWLQTKHSHTLIQVVNRVFVVHILLIQVIEPTKKYKCDIQLCYNNRTKWETYLVSSGLCVFLPLLRLVMLLYVVVVLVVKLIVVKGRGGRREA